MDREDAEARETLGQLARRTLEVFTRDVDGQIGSRRMELFEEQPGLEAAAAAKFDQLAILADGLGHLGGVRFAGSPVLSA